MPGIFSADLLQNDPTKQAKNVPDIITMGKSGNNSNLITVFFSGDGGWFGLEQAIADDLAESGFSTIGIDTRKYLWTRKSPDEVAADIAGLLNYYREKWKSSKYVIAGYSQGAELVPFVYNRLPEELKSNVTSIVMLSPEENTDFEVHISNMLGLGNRQNTYDVITEIKKIEKVRQIIILGESEDSNVPDLLKEKQIVISRIPGSHHYKGNASLIVRTLIEDKAF